MKITLEHTDTAEVEVIIRGDISSKEVTSLLESLKSKNSPGKLILHREDEQFPTEPKDILYIEAANNKVCAITPSGSFDTKLKLYELKDMLDNQGFAQINKSTLVNIDKVKSVQAEFSGNYTLKLKDRKDTLTISRKYFKEFKSKI